MQLLEMIMDNMDNRNQLLSLRLVNSAWKSAATSVLQRRCLELSTSWKPLDQVSRTSWFPHLVVVPTIRKRWLSTAFFPRGVSSLPRGAAPIVTNSLILGDYRLGELPNLQTKKRVNVFTLLRNQGENLTSLQIRDVKTSLGQLYKLLQQTPNLKALILAYIYWQEDHRGATGAEISNYINPVPRLTHLTLRDFPGRVRQWLLKLLGPQLIHLDFICDSTVLPFNRENYDLDTTGSTCRPFHQLKSLRIANPSSEFLLGTGVQLAIPLECLRMTGGWAQPLSGDITVFIERLWLTFCIFSYWKATCGGFNVFTTISSLARFASTLVNFSLDVESIVISNPRQNVARLATFPKLSRVEFCGAFHNGNFDWARNQLLPRFINLKTLRLYGFASWIMNTQHHQGDQPTLEIRAWNFFEQFGLWELCRNLETIEVPHFVHSVSGERVEQVCKFNRSGRSTN